MLMYNTKVKCLNWNRNLLLVYTGTNENIVTVQNLVINDKVYRYLYRLFSYKNNKVIYRV